jgi:hypothetical protein
MRRRSFCVLVLVLPIFPTAAWAQAPTPARVSSPVKALEMRVDCGKKEEMYFHLAGYSAEIRERSTGAYVPFPAPLEVKLEGVPIPAVGESNRWGAGFFGKYYVPPSVPAGSRTLAVRSGAVEGSCTISVKKAPAKLKMQPFQTEALPAMLRDAGLPGQTYLIADAVLTRQHEYTAATDPVGGQAIRFQVNGKEQPPVTTNANGFARLKVKVAPGPADVRATFEGNGQLLGATDSASIQIR